MPIRYVVCLANSKKHGERCIAGVEVVPTVPGRYKVVREGGQPKWLRPVSGSESGEVPLRVVRDIALLDVLEFHVHARAGSGYQAENVAFDERQVRCVNRLAKTHEILNHFVVEPQGRLFGNKGKAVPADKIHEVSHSLMLIRPGDVAFHAGESPSGRRQVRAEFRCGGHTYDLPVTDPAFEAAYLHDPRFTTPFRDYYFTLSLGVEHEGWHYKLVAAVFGMESLASQGR